MFKLSLKKIIESTIKDQTYNFQDIEWKDINISASVGYGLSEKINWNELKLTRSTTPYYGDHAPYEWDNVQIGDEIEIGDYQTVPIIVRIIWVLANRILKSIFFYE